eukprot:CAMPEP_0117750440 /NCGR_PEP_ID=MMETSP0947-20121206/10374_1 /TAXON_ID=44440 /ORGANISM="Chattonella subsalsa, Strain CCMP2191" /LENGTH=1159 /DNA_ID=CAMNT_0005568617 /DNA_START=188 /DNA_END=3664 /DNA_ORIENTATION=+
MLKTTLFLMAFSNVILLLLSLQATSVKSIENHQKKIVEVNTQKLFVGNHEDRRNLESYFIKDTRFAIVRPFAEADAGALLNSFDSWSSFPPCVANSSFNADIFLVFSQDLGDYPTISSNLETFIETKTDWMSCFRNISAISANISSFDDIYHPHQSHNNSLWVNGPNRQFNFIAQAMADETWGSYHFWYLMEGDSTPMKSLWMEDILNEALFHEPFAILGSNFRGDLWDGFLNNIPFSLKHHANGNALYNSSHPLMKWLIDQLSKENTTDSHMAYDYRMAELIFGGNSSDFGYSFLQNYSFFGEMPYINYMSSISNYARTPMIPDFYGGEAVAHGAKNYEKWNRSDHSISLVVSDFGPGSGSDFELMLNSITESEHPFEEVIFVRSNGSELSLPSSYTLNNTKTGGSVQVIEVARNVSFNASYPDFMDWCQANVSSDFFMYTNTFHKLVDPVYILQSKNSSEPYVPYVPADSDACSSYPECVYSILQARNVSGLEDYKYHVLDTEMVFDNSIKTEFCLSWQAWHAKSFGEDECDPISGPTADDYLAYSMANSGISVEVNSKIKQGSKYIAVPHTTPPDDARECSIFVNNLANTSVCGTYTDGFNCLNADGCYWRVNFERCVENDDPNPLLFYSFVESPPPPASNFAIIRPFAASDYVSLLNSFDEWNSFIPCNSSETVHADIFLVFSQNIDEYPTIRSSVEDFLSRSDDWMHCFNSINAVSANISLVDDVYTPHQSHNNSRWVNGPNRQFNFIAQAMANESWGSYDFWYLMEGDSTPIKSFWMDEIVNEAMGHQPFAILGSNFRGDLWDGFLNDIPFSLKHHANGNALYNSSHALMKWLTEHLAMDNSTDSYMAYDYKMSELIFGGNSSDFGYAFLSNFSLFGEMPYINYMSSISNYARTPMIPDFYGGEAVAHGARSYKKWNVSDHSISLVVSDFGPGSGSDFELMLNSITESEHPFEEVIFVRSNGSELSLPSSYTLNNTKTGGSVQVIEVARNVSFNASYPDFMDWCQANVSSDFFMYTNTFHKLVDPVYILQSKNSSEPYVPYVPADSDACSSYPECVYSILQARNVSGLEDYKYHVLDTEMVFDNSIKTEFCLSWQAWHAKSFGEDECDPISGPTADDYLAYSMANSGISVEVNSKIKQGSKYIAVPHTTPPDD